MLAKLFRVLFGSSSDGWTHCTKKLPPWERPVLFCNEMDEEDEALNEFPQNMFAGTLMEVVSTQSSTTLKVGTIAGEILLDAAQAWWMDQPRCHGRKAGSRA